MPVRRRITIIQIVLFFILVVFTFSLFGQTEWKENSYEDFRDGRRKDSIPGAACHTEWRSCSDLSEVVLKFLDNGSRNL